MTASSEAPAKNANGGLYALEQYALEHWGNWVCGKPQKPCSVEFWEATTSFPKPSFVLPGYQPSCPGSMEVVFIYLDLFM